MSRRISHDARDSEVDREYRLIRAEALSLRVDVAALVALDRIVREGVRAFPSRGLEVGGLLTGSSQQGIRLDAVYPLPMECRSSPAFNPSPADLLFVKRAVFFKQAQDTKILGHFRSQTSGEPGPTDADQSIADLLNLPDPVLLLIPASPAGMEPARVYRRVNGCWLFQMSFPLLEPSQLDAPRTTHLRPPLKAGPDASVDPASRGRGRVWAIGGLAVGVGFGVFLSYSVWRTRQAYLAVAPTLSAYSQTVPTRSDLSLQVHPSGDRLQVEWNPASRPVAEASSGILSVQDGDRHLQIPLDSNQLHAGSTVYYPESGLVEIKLEIYRDGNHYTGESVAVTTAPASQPREKPAIAVSPAPSKAPFNTHRTAAQTLPASRPILTEAPAAADRAAFSPGIRETQPARAPVEPPAGADDIVPPFNSTGVAVRYETAVPIRKVRPAVPADLHAALPESVAIEIKVAIDAAGKVVDAAPVGGLTATQKLLAPQALEAARLWRFEPARRNGQPVASESLLKFDFERETH